MMWSVGFGCRDVRSFAARASGRPSLSYLPQASVRLCETLGASVTSRLPCPNNSFTLPFNPTTQIDKNKQ